MDPQYGVAGYRLDFAVRHPDQQGRHVLAIEADGATYHSGWTARERDRLRQQHLEALGWRFCRIWSSDFWRDPDREIDTVLTEVKTAVDRLDAGEPPADPAPGPDPRWTGHAYPPVESARAPTAFTQARQPPSWVRAGASIATYTDVQLIELVVWLRSDGVLRLPDDELAALMGALGYARRGQNIVGRLSSAIATVDRARRS